MKSKGFVFILIICILSITSIGCTKYSKVDRYQGISFEAAKFNQILNPEARKNLEPVYGLDGQAAQKNIDKYRKDFETPPEAPWFFTGISGLKKETSAPRPGQ